MAKNISGARTVRTCISAAILALSIIPQATAQSTSDGGWVEQQGTATRPRLTASQIQSFVPPSRGAFTFPAPYNTHAARLTDASDCGGQDCVFSVGYSYWRNMNNHVGSDEILIFLNFSPQYGGSGATLLKFNKVTQAVTKVGPLFPSGSRFTGQSGQGWYFSATLPTKLYLQDGPQLLRYDVVSQQFETVFDLTAQFGTNRTVLQTHSSNDDTVHSATLQVTDTGESLGCFVYSEVTGRYSYFPKQGAYDECHVDKSGRYLLILENIDGLNDVDNVYIDLQTGIQTVLYDGPQSVTVSHLDMGFGYAAGGNGWTGFPDAVITYYAPTLTAGPVVFYSSAWNEVPVEHVSHLNAKPSIPMSQQYACGSGVDTSSVQNEVTCFRLDTSHQQLVVAPVMTDLNAPGGYADYWKQPKGNLDITGQYFIWTTNLSGSRLDAILVKVPSQLLTGAPTPPAPPVNLRFL